MYVFMRGEIETVSIHYVYQSLWRIIINEITSRLHQIGTWGAYDWIWNHPDGISLTLVPFRAFPEVQMKREKSTFNLGSIIQYLGFRMKKREKQHSLFSDS